MGEAEPHSPMLLLPCLHQVCAGCARDCIHCPVCSQAIAGRTSDSAFMRALVTGDLLPPVENPRASPSSPRCGSMRQLMEEMVRCLNDGFHLDWESNRSLWEERQKQLFNEACSLGMKLGWQVPPATSPRTVCDALGMQGCIRYCVLEEMNRVNSIREARQRMSPSLQPLFDSVRTRPLNHVV